MLNFDFNLKFDEAIEYLKNLDIKTDIDLKKAYQESIYKSFTISKIMRLDIIKDVYDSLVEAIESNKTYQEFLKNIKNTLVAKGWYSELEKPTQEKTEKIYLSARRLKTIFYTNMSISYNVGRYQKMLELNTAIYWRYIAILDANTRKEHMKLHNTIKHRDDPFWQKYYPPNGYNCRCKVSAYTLTDVLKNKWQLNKEIYHDIKIDKNFDVNFAEKTNFKKIYDDKLNSLSTDNNLSTNSLKKIKIEKEIIIDIQDIKDFFNNKIKNLTIALIKNSDINKKNIVLYLNKNYLEEHNLNISEFLLLDYMINNKAITLKKNDSEITIKMSDLFNNYLMTIKKIKNKYYVSKILRQQNEHENKADWD